MAASARWIGPEGPAAAPLAVVGRDLGWQEMRDGRPFVGVAGKILEAALLDNAIPRSVVRISNVIGTRPAADNWHAHSVADVRRGIGELRSFLLQRPKIILALGSVAFLACATGEEPPLDEREIERILQRRYGGSITELRGYVWDGPFGPVCAGIHPAFVARTWLPWRATLTWDLAKCKRYCDHPVQPVRVSRTGVRADVPCLLQADCLAVDSEEGPDGCVAFAATAAEGIAFPLDTEREAIAELLASPARKVFQNAQYDLTKFRRYGFQVGGEIDDIMLAWHAKEPLIAGRSESGTKSTQKSLRFLASVFTDEPFWKDYNFQTAEDKWRLCATDARTTLEIWLRLS